MNKITVLLMVIILAGCQESSDSKSTASKGGPPHPLTVKDYMKIAVSSIQDRMYILNPLIGDSCFLNVHQKNGQLPDSVIMQDGDLQLCDAAISATKKAINDGAYPYPPTDAHPPLPEYVIIEVRPE